jgi:hypothetical protein
MQRCAAVFHLCASLHPCNHIENAACPRAGSIISRARYLALGPTHVLGRSVPHGSQVLHSPPRSIRLTLAASPPYCGSTGPFPLLGNSQWGNCFLHDGKREAETFVGAFFRERFLHVTTLNSMPRHLDLLASEGPGYYIALIHGVALMRDCNNTDAQSP